MAIIMSSGSPTECRGLSERRFHALAADAGDGRPRSVFTRRTETRMVGALFRHETDRILLAAKLPALPHRPDAGISVPRDARTSPQAVDRRPTDPPDCTDEADLAGMVPAPSQRRARACLTCQTSFESEWYGERICRRCKSRAGIRQGKR